MTFRSILILHSLHWGMKMSLNENSSREKILDYIKKYAFDFINHFSDEPWAQPYIDEAAKIYAKERLFDFIRNFSDKPWAQP